MLTTQDISKLTEIFVTKEDFKQEIGKLREEIDSLKQHIGTSTTS